MVGKPDSFLLLSVAAQFVLLFYGLLSGLSLAPSTQLNQELVLCS